MVPTMSGSRDGEKILMHSNGTSMRSQRPLRTTTGNLTLSTSNLTVDLAILDALQQIQDGGSCSNIKDKQL
jgi:hypothetical protein